LVEKMEKQAIVERVRRVAEQAVGERGIEIVNVDITGTKRDSVVRIFIDKEGGVTLQDCTDVSRDVEAVLDVEDFIPTRYVLEVSSPGIERELYSIADFVKFKGQLAKIKLKEAVDGQKTFVGPISEIEGETITVDDRTRGPLTFDYSAVDKANLKIDLSQEFGKRKPAQ
jgi:ribosome maturation factor RimP